MKILYVEDNPGDARLLQETMRERQEVWARDLVVAGRLAEAINVLENHTVDLVLLDLALPDSQGMDTLRKITDRFAALPIVILTGRDDSEMGVSALQEGAQDYLVKGRITPGALIRVARYAVERKSIENRLLKKYEEQEALFIIASALNRTLDLQDLLKEVVGAITALKLEGVQDDIVIFSGHEEGLRKIFDSRQQECTSYKCELIRPDECLCGKAFASGLMILSTDSQTDERHDFCREMPSHGHVIIPLKAKGHIIGILCLYTGANTEIAADTLHLLENIANLLGVALDNARLYEKTKKLALYDPLTGLANRRLLDIVFRRTLARAIRTGLPFALILADIDFFKKFNDSYGHSAGDALLAEVATIFDGHVREEDLVVRYGGEEFLVLLSQEGLDTALVIAERVRESVFKNTTVTISLGVAEFVADMTMEELIASADAALYQAKENGRNRIEVVKLS